MANLIRSAKSASSWTVSDLDAFNIRVVDTNVQAFFGLQHLPASIASPRILGYRHRPAFGLSESESEFFRLLNIVMRERSLESSVDNLAAHILRMSGYRRNDRYINMRQRMPLLMCGMYCQAIPDVCVVDGRTDINLLVQEDKRYQFIPGQNDCSETEPQLIAQAIAAFQVCNRWRTNAGLPPAESVVVPGIIMVGSAPFFYKVTVTRALSRAVERGQYPAHATVVYRFKPPVPNRGNYFVDGMLPLENRRIILACFETFRWFV